MVSARLFLVLLAAFLLRLALLPWFIGRAPAIWDAKEYDAIATHLIELGEFSVVAGEPISRRPPLYPATVALVYAVAGPASYTAVRLLQTFLGLLTALLIHHLARELYDERTALLAAALAAVYPTLWGHAYLLLTEVLFTFWLTLGAYLLVRLATSERPITAVAAGATLGLAALTRSVLQVLPPVLIAMLVWPPRRRSWAAAGLLAVTFALTITPWILRNSRLEGRLTPIDTMAEHVFHLGNARFELSGLRGKFRLATGEVVEPRGNEPEASRGVLGTLRFICRHPWTTLRNDLVKALQFWQLERELVGGAARGYFGPIPEAGIVILAVLINGFYALLILAAIAGLLLDPPEDRRQFWILLTIPAIIWGAHTLTVAHSRYHMPLVPLLGIFAARALVRGRALWREARRGRRLWVLAVAAVLLLSWGVQIVLFDAPELFWGPRG